MKLKLDNGVAVVQDGMPVYVGDDGKDIPFDVVRNMESTKRLQKESQTHREKAEALEAQLKNFEGIDPAKARGAFDTLSKLDQKKLIDAGEVDKVREEVKSAMQKQINDKQQELEAINAKFNAKVVSDTFLRSKYISEKLAVPVDMVLATFSGNFKLEGEKLVGLHPNGEKIYSRGNAGELADFDEALEIIVGRYPYKDTILKSDFKGGSNAALNGGARKAGAGNKTLTRSEFEAMPTMQHAKFFKDGGVVVDD